jgi:hypothetical protein
MVTVFVPVFLMDSVKLLLAAPDVPWVLTCVTVSEDDPMNEKVNAPIHAATAIDTATVTAISMMAATTGLSAFLLFSLRAVFLVIIIPPCLFT